MNFNLFLAITTLISSAANATPHVGDSITHECQMSDHPSYTVKTEIFSIDLSAKLVGIRETYSMPASVPEESVVTLADLDESEKVIGKCGLTEIPGGTLVQVQTPAGNFQACKLSGLDQGQMKSTYLAAVPFQMLKIESANFSCTTIKIHKL